MRAQLRRIVPTLLTALLLGLGAVALSGCSPQGGGADAATNPEAAVPADETAQPPAGSSADETEPSPATTPLAYATGWLVAEAEGIPAGVPVEVLQLPGLDIPAHRGGEAVAADEQAGLAAGWPQAGEGQAVVSLDGAIACIDADLLLVNLPDVLPQACYDIVYSYASTSRCAGLDIPGVTGERLPGYAEGMQPSAYWNAPRFIVPCAYRTACKAQSACDALAAHGLRLLVYDAYRPMTAQIYLADAFRAAFEESPEMQASLGGWSLGWYVADGPSGHNFGTDLDVGVCDMAGEPLPMPSAFDAFDESGHLTDWPMSSGDITPESYRGAVLGNDACMALHEAFAAAGFSELASEWWHFGDSETQWTVRGYVGDGGLDFVADDLADPVVSE